MSLNVDELMLNCISAGGLDRDTALKIYCQNFQYASELEAKRGLAYARKVYERVMAKANLRPALASEFLLMNRKAMEAMYFQGLSTGDWGNYIRFATVMNKTCGFDNPKYEATINNNTMNLSPNELIQRVAQRGQTITHLIAGAGSGSPDAGAVEVPGSNDSISAA